MSHIGQLPLCIIQRHTGLRSKDLTQGLCDSPAHAHVAANIHVPAVLDKGSYVLRLLEYKILNVYLMLLLSRECCVHPELGTQLGGICL